MPSHFYFIAPSNAGHLRGDCVRLRRTLFGFASSIPRYQFDWTPKLVKGLRLFHFIWVSYIYLGALKPEDPWFPKELFTDRAYLTRRRSEDF